MGNQENISKEDSGLKAQLHIYDCQDSGECIKACPEKAIEEGPGRLPAAVCKTDGEYEMLPGKAVIIEDLVTSGGSVLKAISQLEAVQLRVSDVIVLIDREQGGREALAAAGYRLYSALRLHEILDVLHDAGHLSVEELNGIRAYLKEISAESIPAAV